ncbi:hypothetical protein Hanom_Chr11g01005921 [Helianthus anomalus]
MFKNRRAVRLEGLKWPVKLLPSSESSTRRSREVKTGETEPWILKFDKLSEMTRFLEHLIPTHEQRELGLEVFQVWRAKGMESKPCLRVIKVSKSVETEEGIESQSVVIMTNKDNMFSGFLFLFFFLLFQGELGCWYDL